MTIPRVYRCPKIDEIFDELRPKIRAMLVSAELDRALCGTPQPSRLSQLSPQQSLRLIECCRQQIEFYNLLQNTFLKNISQVHELSFCLPSDTPKANVSSNGDDTK